MILIDLGPVFIKLGQALSVRPDLLPAEYIQELSKLQDRVPPCLQLMRKRSCTRR